jgi:hypothetical protein
VVLGAFSWGWDSFVAIGTLALAAGTVWLAWSTRMMASASRKDERAQWRPALVPSVDAPVQYDDGTGEMSFEVRNAGRGPAFGINAQLRSGKRPVGASVPSGAGTAVAVAPGERFLLLCRVSDPSQQIRGWVIEAEIFYYDITERWHRSIFTIAGHKPFDKLGDPSTKPELRIAKAFVYETDREVLPVLGSPKAVEREAREQKGLWRRAKRRIRHP